MRVLVADDARTVRLLVTRGLEALGWSVEAFDNGLSAYEAGLESTFDLALLDHMMPGMLGVEILQGWKEAGITIPALILSGIDDDDVTVQCLELGAVDFIRKPFNVKELQIRAQLHVQRTSAA